MRDNTFGNSKFARALEEICDDTQHHLVSKIMDRFYVKLKQSMHAWQVTLLYQETRRIYEGDTVFPVQISGNLIHLLRETSNARVKEL